MTDLNTANEILKQVMDAYRVFSIELNALRIKKTELVKAILERVDREKTQDVQKLIQQLIYERSNPRQ
jgi:hypothetical protein